MKALSGMVATLQNPRAEYQILEMVGHGQFCTVWRAKAAESLSESWLDQVELPRECAIKVMADDRYTSVDHTRFEREALEVANIRHPNVAKIFGVARLPNGERCIAMEYVREARTIKDAVEHALRRPWDCDLGVVPGLYLQLMYAVDAIHHGGGEFGPILHRDISPWNVLVDRDGVLKLIDFGMAKRLGVTTGLVSARVQGVGTPLFRAPEVGRDPGMATIASDLYSAGAVFAYSLTSDAEFIHKITSMDEPWRTLCGRLLAGEPSDRFGSANEAAVALLRAFNQHQPQWLGNFKTHQGLLVDASAFAGWVDSVDDPFLSVDQTRDRIHYVLRMVQKNAARLGTFERESFAGLLGVLRNDVAADPFENLSHRDLDALVGICHLVCPFMEAKGRLACMGLAAMIGVRCYRYSAMGAVKGMLEREMNEKVRTQMLKSLGLIDPGGIISIS